jgi:hypothetical protein
MMTPDQFEVACMSMQGYFGVVGMFGGNPAMHPQFGELCEIMRAYIPYLQRGLWCNNLRGKGVHARETFNPRHSNLNVHLSSEAYAEFARDWPESVPYLKGLEVDSVHGSPWVAMKDVIKDEQARWDLIGKCDINQFWSACIGVVRGELRAYFCEIAYAMAALHENNPDWDGTGKPMPDTGLAVDRGWWTQGMDAFEGQARLHCHACGIPMRRQGLQATSGEAGEYSPVHSFLARPKASRGQPELVTIGPPPRPNRPATNYLPGLTPGYPG